MLQKSLANNYFDSSLTSPDWEPSGLETGSPEPGGRVAGFKY